MFDGNKFLGLTGTPILKIAFAKIELALAEPEPLTLANLMTNSLTDLFKYLLKERVIIHMPLLSELKTSAYPMRL